MATTTSFLQDVARKYSIDNLESDVFEKFTREQLEKLDATFGFIDLELCSQIDLFASAVVALGGGEVTSKTVILYLKCFELAKQLHEINDS